MEKIDRKIRRRLKIRGNLAAPPWTGRRDISRATLAKWFGEFGYKTGAEIGVQRGKFSLVLCESIPGLKLYCVDPYIVYEHERWSQAKHDMFFRRAKKKLRNYNATFIVKKSIEASFDIEDNSLDFVYIDGSHTFDNVMLDLILWSPKVRSGGIVAGHDFFFQDRIGVVPAVMAYTKAHHIQNWYLTNANPHTTPSFFWVKP